MRPGDAMGLVRALLLALALGGCAAQQAYREGTELALFALAAAERSGVKAPGTLWAEEIGRAHV